MTPARRDSSGSSSSIAARSGSTRVVLVVGLGLLVAFAIRRGPSTSGLVELTPAEQVRYDAAINRVIEDIEAKHGMRPPRVLAPGESGRARSH